MQKLSTSQFQTNMQIESTICIQQIPRKYFEWTRWIWSNHSLNSFFNEHNASNRPLVPVFVSKEELFPLNQKFIQSIMKLLRDELIPKYEVLVNRSLVPEHFFSKIPSICIKYINSKSFFCWQVGVWLIHFNGFITTRLFRIVDLMTGCWQQVWIE